LDQEGEPGIAAEPMAWPPPAEWRYVVSPHPVDRRDPHLYHKTTVRPLYVREFARLQALTGCDEVLFVNERGELTEGSRTSLFIEREGRLLTPPLECGLLDGTLRRAMLETDPALAATAVLRPDDLRTADRVLLGNSVRGLIAATPV
jgi:para-aminobenzoate synthetase/4-amino-4-deoxychorismate lyase